MAKEFKKKIKEWYTSALKADPKFFLYAYLANIITFTLIYWLFNLIDHASSSSHSEEIGLFESFYFSVVTATTLGYGDIKPTDWIGQLSTIVEVLFSIVIFGIFLNSLSERRTRNLELFQREILVEQLLRSYDDLRSNLASICVYATKGEGDGEWRLTTSPTTENMRNYFYDNKDEKLKKLCVELENDKELRNHIKWYFLNFTNDVEFRTANISITDSKADKFFALMRQRANIIKFRDENDRFLIPLIKVLVEDILTNKGGFDGWRDKDLYIENIKKLHPQSGKTLELHPA
ncbi:potassium channel family protein [Microbulbifer sp. GL-2]|uniref:potassium channel family protein n=1 Tax=Microbulbifer sp. GL-2 TaxID=2591606 RepID=UPI001161C91E|nr:potassium channel family protein [Microbulbifer sp. GL-2]BBM00434.1 hypothetical protein GL2_05080 [Microbulbifer sp. GL-2]